MAQLIATGPMAQTLRTPLATVEEGRSLTIGRRGWAVPWEDHLSANHAVVEPLGGGRIRVRQSETASNPVFFRGRPADAFDMVAGEHFVIGQTTFTLLLRDGVAHSDGRPADPRRLTPSSPAAGELTEFTFEPERLRRIAFRDASSRIELLSRLPELIEGSGNADQLATGVGTLLGRGCESARLVSVIDLQTRPAAVLHQTDRGGGLDHGGEPAVLSSTLIQRAVDSGGSVLHLRDASPTEPSHTLVGEIDWAFCVPLAGDPTERWGFYVAGHSADLGESAAKLRTALADDVKFAELVGSMVTSLLRSQRLARRQSSMRGFFAPAVMRAIARDAADGDPQKALAPRAVPLAVMFCDLRGFSAASEAAADRLLELLRQTSDALGIMTGHIHRTGGVIGDFHGDAAMGFWGWPVDQPLGASIVSAMDAAAGIRDDYASGQTAFRCGIGLASGTVVAGRIGTADQVKVTAFGPVVNLAARLEALTKTFGAEIIIDDATATAIDLADSAGGRLRCLGRVQVAGFSQPQRVHQYLPSDGQSSTPQELGDYETAWQLMVEGDWESAYRTLHALPAEDRPKDVLMRLILQHNRRPPPDWQGVLKLDSVK